MTSWHNILFSQEAGNTIERLCDVSKRVHPIHLRQEFDGTPLPVRLLCDVTTEQVGVTRATEMFLHFKINLQLQNHSEPTISYSLDGPCPGQDRI